VSGQTEYSIPVAVKRGLKQIWLDDGSNPPVRLHDNRNELTVAGTASILYTPELSTGTIRLIYDGAHPVISAYNDAISEYVHPKVATCASIIKLLQWYNRQDGNQDSESYLLWLEQEYATKYLPMALMESPIHKTRRSPKYSVFGRETADRPPSPIS
jgi:hypothetical protein